jgi:serine-type D-Ala-D-Ala carboxypeptidase (penicillin-binding protein 5/6)
VARLIEAVAEYCHSVQLQPKRTGMRTPFGVRMTSLAVTSGILVASLAACTGKAGTPQASGADPQPAASNTQLSTPSGTPAQSGMPVANVASVPRRVKATGAALADADTMRLLWSRQLNAERPIGSITKVMTALIVIEAGGLNRQIRIPRAVLRYVTKYQGESAGLHPRDVVTPRELLEALLLESGCDAAYVLATTYGPGMPAFLAKMNAMAQKLGMTHTHFTSPDGLPYPTEYSTYSTPADLLTLGIAAMKLPLFRSIVKQSFYHLARKRGLHHSYWWDNTNDLITSYPGADGIKTGYTDAAKHCLLFQAERHGRMLIGVVLGSPATGPASAAKAATRMLNWGFGLKLAAATGAG